VAGPDVFASAWMSADSGEQWVYVDLGAMCTVDRISLIWIQRAAAGSLQVSDDAKQWNTLQALPVGAANDDIQLGKPARGRYVRVLMTKPEKQGTRYILSEIEIYGRGGLVATPHAPAPLQDDGVLPLAGGNWRVQRASLVPSSGEQLSVAGFADRDWMIATVPGTVLTSYLNDGAIPDPDFGDNQYAI